MALTMDQLKRLLDAQDLHYFLDPRRDALLLGASGLFGKYQAVILLEDQGRCLQFRSIGYLHCPANHQNLPVVLRVLAEINYQYRGIKFGWDPKDGEITVYSDVWIQDGTITQDQFARCVQVFFSGVDMNHSRIGKAIETGEDSGDFDPRDIVGEIEKRGPSLPPALKVLIDKLMGRSKPDDDDRHI